MNEKTKNAMRFTTMWGQHVELETEERIPILNPESKWLPANCYIVHASEDACGYRIRVSDEWRPSKSLSETRSISIIKSCPSMSVIRSMSSSSHSMYRSSRYSFTDSSRNCSSCATALLAYFTNCFQAFML